ncbi:MAG: serine/threonine-protein kinase [Nocardioides sp.]
MIAGRYALGRELGRGGMGAVWLGTDEVLGRPVALKKIALVHDPAHARAEREARLAARVSHPHVVGVYDLVTDGADQWLVMEYVAGTTLSARIAAQGPLSPDELAPILKQIADALAAAHDAGVVHRDVKPSNILIDEIGTAKLSDFGIARSDDADATMTQSGFLTGSPSYIAPEVAHGKPTTPASDVWSLGATAYSALAGRPPYEVGENVVSTLFQIVHEDPPRTERAGRLAPLIAGMMTKDPEQRWTLDQVRRFLDGRPVLAWEQTRTMPRIVAPPPARPPERRPRWLWAAGALAAVTAAVLGGILLHGGGDDGDANAASGRASASTGASTGATPAGATTPSPSASASASDAAMQERIRAFVMTYLQTASSDPPRGFAMLTPDYQRRSGGLAGYLRFWGKVRKIHDVTDVQPSLDPLGVSYRYSYTLRGAGKRTEDVQLRLVDDGGRLRIAAS